MAQQVYRPGISAQSPIERALQPTKVASSYYKIIPTLYVFIIHGTIYSFIQRCCVTKILPPGLCSVRAPRAGWTLIRTFYVRGIWVQQCLTFPKQIVPQRPAPCCKSPLEINGHSGTMLPAIKFHINHRKAAKQNCINPSPGGKKTPSRNFTKRNILEYFLLGVYGFNLGPGLDMQCLNEALRRIRDRKKDFTFIEYLGIHCYFVLKLFS